ncbi:stage V sporulation protein AA [Anaeromicropila herbilytica]|uniref:Stage V sporulation protein AA n=1 Tax=Anaeromicropila herbilytica TaxID=2785025 RepID=A0A7R7EJP1_9FIRM|nr:stage V sporulation protein AA [Anaeromicropila herbilytica]BCN30030.1 stage V sporulation protein AA [Anaeromicropila herbilytica]
MKETLVYLKADKHNEVTDKTVLLSDIAKVYGRNTKIIDELKNVKLFDIQSDKECKYMFSVLRVIELIIAIYPELEIISLGETDFIVEYKKPRKSKVVFEYMKTAFVALSIFFGSAFSIMTFNEDVSVSKVFDLVYKLVMGSEKQGGSILEISYSIGLPIGIIIFFNHFSKFKLHNDPTPIQIQMRLYENDVNDTLITDANREGNTIDCN